MKRFSFILAILITISASCIKETPNKPPFVEIINPSADTSLAIDENINFKVNAYDEDGEIYAIGFYFNDFLMKFDEEAPYDFLWHFGNPGIYKITVKAADNEEAESTSEPVYINAFDPGIPVVELNFTNNYNPIEYDTVTFGVEASTTIGTISKASVYIDGNLFGEDLYSPYRINWDNVPAGVYSVYASAESSEGVIGWSETLSLEVLENRNPTIHIDYPNEDHNSFIPGIPVNIGWYCYDPEGEMDKIELYADGDLLVTFDLAYDYSWLNAPMGEHTIQAVVYDRRGGIGYSQEVSLTVLTGIYVDGLICDLAPGEEENQVFALNRPDGKLLLINPVEVSSTNIELPYNEPVAMDYSPDQNKLYIIYNSCGNLSILDKTTQEVSNYLYAQTGYGLDIKVDDLHHRIYIVSSLGLYILNQDDGSILLENEPVFGNSMAIDREKRWLFTAQEDYDPAKIAKYSVEGDQLEFLQSNNNCGTDSHRVEINPNGEYVLLPTTGGNGMGHSMYAYDTENLVNVLAEFDLGSFPQCVTFSPDGQTLYGCDGSINDNYIYVLDAGTFLLKEKLYFPGVDFYARMATNSTGSRLLAFNDEVLPNGSYIIYIYGY